MVATVFELVGVLLDLVVDQVTEPTVVILVRVRGDHGVDAHCVLAGVGTIFLLQVIVVELPVDEIGAASSWFAGTSAGLHRRPRM